MASVQIGPQAYAPEVVLALARRQRNWLVWIVILSVVNTILVFARANVTFVIGLGVTQLADSFAVVARERASGPIVAVLTAVGIAIDLVTLGLYLLLWWLSGRGSVAAYVTAIVFYALDALIMLAFHEWFGAAFHAYVLFHLVSGYKFVKAHREAVSALAAPEVPVGTGS